MDLERLIAAEERNEALIVEARTEGQRLVAEATAAAAAREAGLRAEVDQAVAERVAELAADEARRIEELRAAARRAVARYDAVSDQEIAALVPGLIDRLVAEGEV